MKISREAKNKMKNFNVQHVLLLLLTVFYYRNDGAIAILE